MGVITLIHDNFSSVFFVFNRIIQFSNDVQVFSTIIKVMFLTNLLDHKLNFDGNCVKLLKNKILSMCFRIVGRL